MLLTRDMAWEWDNRSVVCKVGGGSWSWRTVDHGGHLLPGQHRQVGQFEL